jgi:hypothetical protein
VWNPEAVDQLLTDEHVNDLYDAEANETLWALADRLGSVTEMVDNYGGLRLHRAFDSYGNIVDETHYDAEGLEVTGYLDEAFAYTGRFFDSATGLQNNLNRWYDASIGKVAVRGSDWFRGRRCEFVSVRGEWTGECDGPLGIGSCHNRDRRWGQSDDHWRGNCCSGSSSYRRRRSSDCFTSCWLLRWELDRK